MTGMDRAEFAFTNINDFLEGGTPRGSIISIYGNPGAYKTLHSLSFALAGHANGEPVVYVSTEQSYRHLIEQAGRLSWRFNRNEIHHFTSESTKTPEENYAVVFVDLDSLYDVAITLKRLMREEQEGYAKKKYYWYNDPNLVTYVIILALEKAGVLERRGPTGIDPDEVTRLRLRAGRNVRVYTQTHARVIVDSFSAIYAGRWSIAGKMLTDFKVRMEMDNITYLMTFHVSRAHEEEMGAQVGHIVDGRIRLWLTEKGGELITEGAIMKMRLTNHSRRIHTVKLETSKKPAFLRWM